MPKYPGAEWRPVSRYQSGSLRVSMTPRRCILHTAVSSASSMHSYFDVAGRATPHFYVNKEGDLEQFIDTDFRGTACLDGNHDSIAVESWDDAGRVKEWTPGQVEALAKLAVWCHKTHGIPLARCPSSLSGTKGIGWHRLGIDGTFPQPDGQLLGGRVEGGEHWSTSAGKICPFDGKIRGTVNLIIPRAKALLAGDDMSAEDVQAIKAKIEESETRIIEVVNARAKAGRTQLTAQVARALKAIDALPDGATKAEVKSLIQNIEATIHIVVNDDPV